MVGKIKVRKDFVPSKFANLFYAHTRVVDTSYFEEDLKASLAIVHGFGEDSDVFLEPALNYALNGFDVHLIDMRGYGYSAGARGAKQTLVSFHEDVVVLL